ncbi:hypothetical protein NRBB52_1485 [Bifidobacterium breve]|nr:hypothetical protein NRBB52_1485 [Bifidobacterium breve]
MGSDCSSRCLRMTAPIFQSTLPGWGATWDSPSSFSGAKISIHAPRMGSDLKSFADCLKPFLFQSTLPGWGATHEQRQHVPHVEISIHAPRMGSDLIGGPGVAIVPAISIHAPRMGSDRENGHLRPRYGQNHPFSTLIVSQIVVDVLGTVRKSQKHQRTSHYEVIKQPERQK